MRAILRALFLLVISSQVWAFGLADLTDKDASGGLKEALAQGAAKAVGQLGADGGFMNNPKVKIGLPESLSKQVYASYLAGFFRSVRFGASEAHGRANLISFNYLREKGGVLFDPATHLFRVDFDKIAGAVKELAADLLEGAQSSARLSVQELLDLIRQPLSPAIPA